LKQPSDGAGETSKKRKITSCMVERLQYTRVCTQTLHTI
jgi:hypothetical protein